ncbi:hypothetical protein A9G41_09155 [Gilliamella sp. Nev5-1]|uniref:hypothetical protein n=1 Tax=Gilliamella sp. Nev3-1 TaxID=3120250 RepID=UPI00080E3E59|nr:hypothetical protein [Gilliamella apicola]OCG58455.1 hypothetical protein A9G40_10305 [Gilliamella apicola]OCG67715.1 hypothetical protein A9G41_09155 [Gilliamella apicola]
MQFVSTTVKTAKKIMYIHYFINLTELILMLKVTTDIAKWYEDSDKLFKAINYYSYCIDKDPELLLNNSRII